MRRIKIGIAILTSITVVSLVFGGFVFAQPPFKVKKVSKTEYVSDEIVVKFKRDIKPFRVIKVPKGRVREKIREYLKRRDVEYAEPNYIAYALMVPNDPYYSYQWHLDNSEYGGIGMEEAWDISAGAGVTVAIVDSGVAYENYRESWWRKYEQAPDLAGTCFVSGYDFVNNDSHPNDDSNPGHGTHVAGTVAQSANNKFGVAGVAFNACLMPVKVLDGNGSGTYADVAEGIRWAVDNGAKVINLSLGGQADSEVLKEAVKYAYENGVTVIAAAGNDGSATLNYPAAYDDYVIAVGATQYDETLAPYSNYGASLDIVAPGGNNALDQNGDGYGDGVLQQTYERKGWWRYSWGYYFMSGTSMAAPHVSGVAALVIANGIATTPDEVRAVLQETAEDLGVPGRDDTYGWGLVDATAALNYKIEPECTVDSDCDDGLYCNGSETCQAGFCQPGTPIDCSALTDQCNEGVCDETLDKCIVQSKPDGTPCNDGLYCNVGETCQAGVCTGGSARNCDDGERCTEDSCDEISDVCINTWPACGISDGCCGPECDSTNDSDCQVAVKCWSGKYRYLKRSRSQFRKFCKCAEGNYGYKSYSYVRGRQTAYRYVDSGDNENWETKPTSTYYPASRVKCIDGSWYYTNQDYYFK
ncbi:peptidase S8 [bacterium]|nr:peptidase S8 [bacterium]